MRTRTYPPRRRWRLPRCMMTMSYAVLFATARTTFALALITFSSPTLAQTSQTTGGEIPLRFGLPADEAARQKLYDEMDFQRATQAYIWGLPIVSFAQWQYSAHSDLGASDTDMVIYESVKDKFGILTANATTPYIGGFPDLSKTGPLVIDYPSGATAGGIGDFWQR